MTASHTSRSVLVVDSDPATLFATVDFLRRGGHHIKTASTFEEAKQLLMLDSPDLLIADVRLGAFNGLHLALRRYYYQPESASIITSARADRMLEEAALRIGVPYLVKPIESVELLALVDRLLEKDALTRTAFRHWPRRRISGGLGAMVDDMPAVVLDVSDEGLCLEIPQISEQGIPDFFYVSVPAFGLLVSVDPIWTKMDAESGVLKCGAALQPADLDTMQAWRGFVDTLV